MELQSGRSIKEIVHSYPMDQQQELASLLEVDVHLQELPRNIELPGTNKARLRAQLMSQIAHPTPRPARFSWRNPLAGVAELFSMPRLQPMLLRPLGAALSAFMAISLVSGGTVYASMDTIPGDNLYPVKIAVEQTRLNLNFNEEGRAETYLWMANARVGELNRMVSEGRLDEAPMVIANYEHSVSEAIRLVSVEKDPRTPSFYEQANTVQTALVALYEKAPVSVQSILGNSLSLASTFSPDESIASQSSDVVPAKDAPALQIPSRDTSVTTELPRDPTLPRNRGAVSPEPPIKTSPLSNPPSDDVVTIDTPTAKGNLGPETGPVTSSEQQPLTLPSSDEGKDTPLSTTPANVDDKTPSGLNSIPLPQDKTGGAVQGVSSSTIPGKQAP